MLLTQAAPHYEGSITIVLLNPDNTIRDNPAGRSGERPRDSVRIAVSAARPTVVIVGAGFGGLRAARVLGRAPVNVVLLDRHNYHLFQPLL